MKSSNNYTLLSVSNISLILLITAGIGVYLVWAHKVIDDLMYSSPLRTWMVDHHAKLAECGWDALREGFPMDLIKAVWYQHIQCDNGRLGNITVVFFMLLPKWFGSIVALGFWCLCMFASFRLASVSICRSPIVAVGLFLWSFFIPWSDWLGTLDYQFNYLIPSGLMMWYLVMVRKSPNSTASYVWLIVLGIITGAWHEGFAGPVLGGGLLLMILFKEYRQKRYYVAFGSLAMGLLYLVLCPGTAVRISGHTGIALCSLVLIAQLSLSHLTYIVMTIWCLIKMKKSRDKRFNPLVLFALVSGGVAIIIQIMTNGVRHGGWWADIISVVGIMMLLKETPVLAWCRKKLVIHGVYALFAILSVWHWIAVDYYSLHAYKLFEEIMTQYETRHQREFFVDTKSVYDLPLICLWTPNMREFLEGWSIETFRAYYNDFETNQFIAVIPEKLRNITIADGKPVPGGSGIFQKDGLLFMTASDSEVFRLRGVIRMSTGLGGEEWFIVRTFRSEGDGNLYRYLYPYDNNWKVLFGEIESIELDPDS